MGGVGTDAFSKFDKLEGKIEKLEAEATAFEQLAGENSSLDEEFRQLATNSTVEQQLLDMKKQMGLLGAAPEAENKPTE